MGALFPELKWLGHKADYSLPSGDEIKNAWSYAAALPYIFMTWKLSKHRTLLSYFYYRK
jgi:hypothetical protein